jgi:hypothetical protein
VVAACAAGVPPVQAEERRHPTARGRNKPRRPARPPSSGAAPHTHAPCPALPDSSAQQRWGTTRAGLQQAALVPSALRRGGPGAPEKE